MTYLRQLFLVSCLLSSLSVFGQDKLDGKQLYLLMKASSQRYQSIEAEIENTCFQFQSDLTNRQVQYIRKLNYKRDSSQEYYDSTRYAISDSKQLFQGQIIYYSAKGVFTTASQSSKTFPWKATVEKIEDKDNDRLFTGILDALWDTRGYGIDSLKAKIDRAEVTFDPNIKCYTLKIFFGTSDGDGTPFKIWIDPNKDYITAKTETYLPDGPLFIRNECREFEKINGLWIPIHYGWIDPSAQYGGDYEVVSVRVNAPNENTNKYFEFPENARVVDKIRGVQYTIKKNKVSNEMSSPVNSVPPITLLPSPATDTQLADTALKAQELMAEEQKRASGTAPLVVPIDIVPAYVWVLPGKNEYVLSISAGGPKPSLVKHTFDPDGLVMQGLEDKIASDGKIRVSLKRPAEQKAFANGVLTLDFADQTKTVHFVAAPVIIE